MIGRLTGTMLVLAALVSACDIQRGAEVAPRPEEPEREGAPPPPPPSAPRHLEGEAVEPGSVPVESLERVELGPGSTLGEATIEVSDARLQQGVEALIDGNPESLALSDGTNPVILTVTLPQPIRLRVARMYFAASPYDWVLEPVPGETRLLVSGAPERTWSQIDLPEAVETSVVRFEVLRLERDDYVHLNEVELYAERR